MLEEIEYSLSYVRGLQGKSLTSDEAKWLEKAQLSAIKEGYRIVDNFTGKRYEPPKDDTQKLYNALLEHTSYILSSPIVKDPSGFIARQDCLYEQTHSAAISNADKFGFEFLIGLSRLTAVARLEQAFIKYLQENTDGDCRHWNTQNYDSACANLDEVNLAKPFNFFEAIEASSAVIDASIELMMSMSPKRTSIISNFMEHADQFAQANPDADQLMKKLHSIQHDGITEDYVPFRTLAQQAHWNGLGGNNSLIEASEKLSKLNNLRRLKISYHHATVKPNDPDKMSPLVPFGVQQNQITAYAHNVAKQLLKNRPQHSSEPIRILDAFSGPNFAATFALVDQLISEGKNVELSASEISGDSLRKLFSYRDNPAQLWKDMNKPIPDNLQDGSTSFVIKDIVYHDLNRVGTECADQLKPNSFDLIFTRNAMHSSNMHNVMRNIQYQTSLCKPGGIILNPDVAKGARRHVIPIPGNITDHEGYVFDVADIDFHKTAVPAKRSENVLIPFPLREIGGRAPHNEVYTKDEQDGKRVYNCNTYRVIEINRGYLPKLQKMWDDVNVELLSSSREGAEQKLQEVNKWVEYNMQRNDYVLVNTDAQRDIAYAANGPECFKARNADHETQQKQAGRAINATCARNTAAYKIERFCRSKVAQGTIAPAV